MEPVCLETLQQQQKKKQKQKENLLAKLKIRVKLLLVSSWSVTYRFFLSFQMGC